MLLLAQWIPEYVRRCQCVLSLSLCLGSPRNDHLQWEQDLASPALCQPWPRGLHEVIMAFSEEHCKIQGHLEDVAGLCLLSQTGLRCWWLRVAACRLVVAAGILPALSSCIRLCFTTHSSSVEIRRQCEGGRLFSVS